MAVGEASGPWRRAQPQGCRGHSGEIPARTIGADQHSPAREACLLTCWGERGLRAEARASEVRSQGEDRGRLREHSLKGATAPQLARRESREKSSTDEWIKKMWHIYIMEYYSAIKRNEIKLFVVRWMDLESVTQSELSQKEKNKYHMLTHMYGI